MWLCTKTGQKQVFAHKRGNLAQEWLNQRNKPMINESPNQVITRSKWVLKIVYRRGVEMKGLKIKENGGYQKCHKK